MQATLPRRSYDHRIREAICETRDPDLFPELQIPGSTIRCWLHRGAADVETVGVLEEGRLNLLAQNRELQRRVALLGAMVGVLVALIRVSKCRLDFERIPDANSKRVLLRAIERSKKAMPLSASPSDWLGIDPQDAECASLGQGERCCCCNARLQNVLERSGDRIPGDPTHSHLIKINTYIDAFI